jgi:hypothetical protein
MDADRFSNRKHHHHITTTTRTATPGEELYVHEILRISWGVVALQVLLVQEADRQDKYSPTLKHSLVDLEVHLYFHKNYSILYYISIGAGV